MMEEDRVDRVRAVLAASSHETTAPENGKAFVELVRTVGLPVSESNGSTGDTDYSMAKDAHATAQAERLAKSATAREAAEAATELLAPILADLRKMLRAEVERASSALPLRLSLYNVSDVPIDDPPQRHLSEAALDEVGKRPCLSSVTGGTDPRRRFHVYMTCMWVQRDEQRDEELPFQITVSVRHETGAFRGQDAIFGFRRNGDLFPRTTSASAQTPVELLKRWLADQAHWAET